MALSFPSEMTFSCEYITLHSLLSVNRIFTGVDCKGDRMTKKKEKEKKKREEKLERMSASE